jgi:hypothetical protein
MTEPADLTAKLEGALGPIARNFDELARMIAQSSLPVNWGRDGILATQGLADALRPDWMARFAARNGQPYLKFVLASYSLPHLVGIVELAARLKVLADSPGFTDVRRHMRSQLEPGTMNHSGLQLEVAALEKRRSGHVVMEYDQGEGNWKPDVVLSHLDAPIKVECFWLTIADEIASHLADPEAPERVVDGWRRVGAKIVVKAGQPAAAGGWLRCELDDGMFADQPWFSSALSDMPLSEKARVLSAGVRESMQIVGKVHGVVLSSPATSNPTGQEETHRLPDDCTTLRRRLPGGRIHEVFIIPSEYAAASEVDMWFELYDQEPSWLGWAMESWVKPENQ